MTTISNPLFCALDTGSLDRALDWARPLAGIVGGFKLGLEFFTTLGARGVERVAELGAPVFLDLKFHDIPNTVAGAVRAAVPLAPRILTVHAAGGVEMMRIAAETAADEADRRDIDRPWVVGVTVLTSLDAGDLDALGIEGSTHRTVARLTRLAEKAGLDGVVCAPHEVSTARSTMGGSFKLVVPGIRPAGASTNDQKRVMTPHQAIEAGADILVVGRPITTAPDPVRAAQAILASIAG